MVLTDCIKFETTIKFRDLRSFHQIMVGESTIDEEITSGQLKITGPAEEISAFKARFRKISPTLPTVQNAAVPVRENRILSSEELPPIKSGWLLKKRDIISGWKCRYFEVYKDRLDYYADQNDTRPRGSYPLFGVDVHSVKPIKVKRRSEHYGFL